MYLSARERHILSSLLASSEGITVKQLADDLHVSQRTIHRDLPGVEQVLSSFQLQLAKETGKGMLLEGAGPQIEQLKQELQQHEPVEYSPEERQHLLSSILLQSKEPVKLYTLAKELGVTIATASNDLNKLKDWLYPHQLELVRRRGYGVYVEGEESLKRRALRNLLTEYASEEELFSFLDDSFQKEHIERQASKKLLNVIDAGVLHEVLLALRDLHQAYSEPIADTSYLGLVIHLGLATERICQGEEIVMDEATLEELKQQPEYDWAKTVLKKLEERLELTIPTSEIGYVTMHLLGAKQIAPQVYVQEEQALELTRKITKLIQLVEQEWELPLANDIALRDGLITHLKPALYRIRQQMKIHNPLLSHIQTDYPALFSSLKTKAAQVFPDPMPDEEVGFLVMHFWSAMERMRNEKKLRAIVVCSSGLGTSKMLAARLKKEIPEIEEVTHASALDVQAIAKERRDLLISTIPLRDRDDYVLVTPFLSGKEITAIRQTIQQSQWLGDNELEKEPTQINESTASFRGIEQLSSLIQSILEHFQVSSWNEQTDAETVLSQICTQQEKNGWLVNGEQVKDQLLERQHLGGLAIPETELALFHTRSDDVQVPSFTIHELKSPIRVRAMDNSETSVRRLLLMLAPATWHEEGLGVMSYISTLIIESDEHIARFEQGGQAELYQLLEKRLKDYLIEKIHE
ncbi:BglG family transcription antiterminator [Salsuginibacillus kocurii]|uniref:BglG family transcription antiterminator n=1 Tax=Salsuginibacillus kocurii TaxID=427078 RepID=UPI000368C227|nr:BglG family transcription antiterminator [Salsuginibacillus kocurii]